MSVCILSLPSEIHLAIFKALNGPIDILNLSSTCRSLRGLLTSNTRTLLRKAASQRFLMFDDCLRAARASKLPLEWEGNHFDLAEKRYPTPPTKAFCEGLAAAPPTFDELLAVKQISRMLAGWLNQFQEIVQIEWITEHGEESFYRAGARYLVMSYLFSGAFLEPLRARKLPDDHSATDTDEDGMTRFPPYHATDPDWRYAQLESLYGGFIEWIVEDGEKQGPIKSWTSARDSNNLNFNPFRKILRSLLGMGPELKPRVPYSGLAEVSSLLLMLELNTFLATEVPCVVMEEEEKTGAESSEHSLLRLCHFGDFRPKFEHRSNRTGRDLVVGYLACPGDYAAEEFAAPTRVLQYVFRPPSSLNDVEEVYRPYMDFFRIAFKNRRIAFYRVPHSRFRGHSNFFLYDRSTHA
ncbi:hypothetical protein P167DRAFT_609244 [Morchella conica CCBAS932]|uniref:F-box domain-containing protein n=1 Tax=Morchella conica CCBAS932 TaxID=1392247 RepID=A0A3N4KB43_9PEZI|nr:hypothetical protein P167DRAFT_609244 [Morchella conica CCBAS932]